MFKNIAVAFDESPEAQRAFHAAAISSITFTLMHGDGTCLTRMTGLFVSKQRPGR